MGTLRDVTYTLEMKIRSVCLQKQDASAESKTAKQVTHTSQEEESNVIEAVHNLNHETKTSGTAPVLHQRALKAKTIKYTKKWSQSKMTSVAKTAFNVDTLTMNGLLTQWIPMCEAPLET